VRPGHDEANDERQQRATAAERDEQRSTDPHAQQHEAVHDEPVGEARRGQRRCEQDEGDRDVPWLWEEQRYSGLGPGGQTFWFHDQQRGQEGDSCDGPGHGTHHRPLDDRDDRRAAHPLLVGPQERKGPEGEAAVVDRRETANGLEQGYGSGKPVDSELHGPEAAQHGGDQSRSVARNRRPGPEGTGEHHRKQELADDDGRPARIGKPLAKRCVEDEAEEERA
jgi:hypothetical protein